MGASREHEFVDVGALNGSRQRTISNVGDAQEPQGNRSFVVTMTLSAELSTRRATIQRFTVV
jgi:hypothetical protein